MAPDVAEIIETFPALTEFAAMAGHGFVRRVPGVELTQSKAEVVERLAPWHAAVVQALGFSGDRLRTAEQVHGDGIAVLTNGSPVHSPGVDGLMTDVPGLMLGIHVADCGPVFILDPVRRAIAVLHSGRKGSELGITGKAIRLMQEHYGSDPANLVVQLGPCIRVPRYEVDFPAQIIRSCQDAGVPENRIHDCGTCTALDPDRYYSYRRDLGKTGRLLALIGLRPA